MTQEVPVARSGPSAGDAAPRPSLRAAIAVAALGFALSGFWIVTNPQRPTPDAALYEGIAANLAAGNGFSYDREPPHRPEITRTPFLPAWTAALFAVFGRDTAPVLWANALLIALALALGYAVAVELFRDRAAALGGALLAALDRKSTRLNSSHYS